MFGGALVLAAGSSFRKSFLALLAAAGFFVLGYGALKLTPEGSTVAIIWPADAFALCLMLRYAKGWQERGVLLAVLFVTDLFVNRLAGSNPVLVTGYSAVDILELALCLHLAGPMRALRFKNARAVMLFGLKVGILPPLLGGVAAMLVTIAGHGAGAADAFAGGRNWFFADVLGFCIVFPIGMTSPGGRSKSSGCASACLWRCSRFSCWCRLPCWYFRCTTTRCSSWSCLRPW